MPAQLATHATERSTFVITASFANEDGEAVTPDSIAWKLTDRAGTVINSRTSVSVTPAASIEIVLSSADLDYDDGTYRVLTVEATYTSTLGSGLPLKDQVTFTIDNLLTV